MKGHVDGYACQYGKYTLNAGQNLLFVCQQTDGNTITIVEIIVENTF